MTGEQPPTELARPVDDTESSLAWSIDDSPEVVAYRSPWIARVAVGAALILIAGAGGVALFHVRGAAPAPLPPVAAPVIATPEPVATTSPPPPSTTTSAPPVTSKVQRSPKPVESAAMRRPPPETVTVQAPVPRPVQPTLEELNVMFLSSLRRQGWTIFQPDLMITRAHQVCAEFAMGSSAAYVNSWLVNAGNVSDYASAEMFTSTARAVYAC